MRPVCTARRAAGLTLLAVSCGCHDWAPVADAAGDGADAADVEEFIDALDLPPEVADRADTPVDGPGDEGGVDGVDAADAPDEAVDDSGPEVPPSVCGNGVLEPGEDCEREQKVECTTTCGSPSSAECPDDCRAPPPERCPLPEEECNGRDDDCNGGVDDPATVCPDCVVVEHAGRVYHFCEDRPWVEASAACRERGMYLATIDDAAENAWLTSTATALGTGPWWFGFNDRASEGVWVWDGPSPLVPFEAWGTGEPNDYGTGEDCAELLFSASGWNDSNCAVGQPYICEYP